MVPLFATLDLTSADAVIDVLSRAAAANRTARCRRGSVDVISLDDEPARLIATGDLHDNPLHLARLAAAAGLGDPSSSPRAHLTLHEVIHPDTLVNGMDFSFRALTRIAALKAAHPEQIHALLANHELAQVIGSGIVKDGVRVVDAFNEGVHYAFGEQAAAVLDAIKDFIRSMPLALLVERPDGARPILCAHSLPPPELMPRFDPAILDRDLTEDDYIPRQGSAHLMVWGRGHTPDQLAALAKTWNVGLFILGHEKADTGALPVPPNALVLNSDHQRGVYLPVDLCSPPTLGEALAAVRPLSDAAAAM